MKILNVRHADLVNEFYVTSEVEIVRSLNRLGHDATLIGMGAGTRDFGTPVRLIRAPADRSFIFRLKLFFLLPFWVLSRRIDVVMVDVRTARSTSLLLPLKWLGLCKLILDIRTIPVESKVTWRFTDGLKFARKWFDGASMITSGTRRHIADKMGVVFDKSVIWTSGVNVQIFSPTALRADGATLARTAGCFVLFYHGTISPNRGIGDIVDALNQVKDRIPNVLLVSLSNNNTFIKDHCATHGYRLDEHLLLLDAVDNTQVPRYVQLADLCLVPLPRIDWWEVSSPLKLMEYLAMAKPTVLTDIKAHLEAVPRDAPYARYYDPDRPGDLAEKLLEAHAQHAQMAAAGHLGRMTVTNEFTWDRQAEKLADFIRTL